MTVTLKKSLPGVGGWLWWLVAGMLVIGPMLGTVMLLGATYGQERLTPALAKPEQYQNFKTLVWVTYIIFIGIQIHAGWALAKRRDPSAVSLAKRALWLSGPVAAFCMGIVVPAMTLDHWGTMVVATIGQIIGASIWAGIWTAYLNRSMRVRNTYGLGDTESRGQVADNNSTRQAAASEATALHQPDAITDVPGNLEFSGSAEDQIYAQIADELDGGNLDKATWTKAYAVSDGEDKKSRSLYIKLRFEKLVSDWDNAQPKVDVELPRQEMPSPQILLDKRTIEKRDRAVAAIVGLVVVSIFAIAAFQPSRNQRSGSEQQGATNQPVAVEVPRMEAPTAAPSFTPYTQEQMDKANAALDAKTPAAPPVTQPTLQQAINQTNKRLAAADALLRATSEKQTPTHLDPSVQAVSDSLGNLKPAKAAAREPASLWYDPSAQYHETDTADLVRQRGIREQQSKNNWWPWR